MLCIITKKSKEMNHFFCRVPKKMIWNMPFAGKEKGADNFVDFFYRIGKMRKKLPNTQKQAMITMQEMAVFNSLYGS